MNRATICYEKPSERLSEEQKKKLDEEIRNLLIPEQFEKLEKEILQHFRKMMPHLKPFLIKIRDIYRYVIVLYEDHAQNIDKLPQGFEKSMGLSLSGMLYREKLELMNKMIALMPYFYNERELSESLSYLRELIASFKRLPELSKKHPQKRKQKKS